MNDKKIIEINYHEDEKNYIFEIKDNGIGIPEEYQEQIFKIFKRLHERNAYGGGTGAGIAIMNESSPLIMGNQFMNNEVSGYCDCICYFGGGIYVDETSWPIVGSTISETNIFLSNSADLSI